MTGQRKIVVKPDEAAVIEELCSIIQTKAKVGGLFATILITEGQVAYFALGSHCKYFRPMILIRLQSKHHFKIRTQCYVLIAKLPYV